MRERVCVCVSVRKKYLCGHLVFGLYIEHTCRCRQTKNYLKDHIEKKKYKQRKKKHEIKFIFGLQ